MITHKEVKLLVEALRESRHGGSLTREECLTLIGWAQQAKTNYAVLRGVLRGKVEVNVLDGEVVFRGDEIIEDVRKAGRKL